MDYCYFTLLRMDRVDAESFAEGRHCSESGRKWRFLLGLPTSHNHPLRTGAADAGESTWKGIQMCGIGCRGNNNFRNLFSLFSIVRVSNIQLHGVVKPLLLLMIPCAWALVYSILESLLKNINKCRVQ